MKTVNEQGSRQISEKFLIPVQGQVLLQVCVPISESFQRRVWGQVDGHVWGQVRGQVWMQVNSQSKELL